MYKLIKNSDFIGKIILLVTGTVIAQSITYLLSPVISRLYTPEQMSYLTLLIRISSFFAVISTGRFEIAFTLPKRDEHAFSLYKFTLSLTFLVVLFSIIIIYFFDYFHFQQYYLRPILYFIPLAILLVSFNSQGVNWAVRKKDFKSINTSKILQSSINSILCVFLGWYSYGVNGLIISFLVSLFVSNIPFFTSFLSTYYDLKFYRFNRNKYLILKEYIGFPKINLPHVLMDLTKDLFIAFYLIYLFDKEVLGLYDFSYRMLRLPITFIGVSISQVLFKKTVDLVNEKKSIYPIVRKTILMLFLLSIVPFGILFFYGSDIFGYIFGENWREAGVFCEIMSPWLMINFIVSPISQIPTVLNKQKTFFMLSLISTLIMVLTFLLNQIISNINFVDTLRILSISQFFCLLFILFWILSISKKAISKI